MFCSELCKWSLLPVFLMENLAMSVMFESWVTCICAEFELPCLVTILSLSSWASSGWLLLNLRYLTCHKDPFVVPLDWYWNIEHVIKMQIWTDLSLGLRWLCISNCKLRVDLFRNCSCLFVVLMLVMIFLCWTWASLRIYHKLYRNVEFVICDEHLWQM